MKNAIKWFNRLGLLLIVAILTGVGILFRPTQKDLLKQAVMVWELPGKVPAIKTVHWLSPSRFLVLQWSFKLMRQCTDATLFDLSGRRSVPMTPLLNRLKASRVGSDDLLVSPDARSLLATGIGPGNRVTRSLFTLDGKSGLDDSAYLPGSPFDATLWMQDSKHLVTLNDFGGTLRGRYYSVADHSATELPPLTSTGGTLYRQNCYCYLSQAGDSLFACCVPQNGTASSCFLTHLHIGTSARILSSGTAQVPLGSYINQVVISPRGDRVAWALICHSDPPLSHFLRSFLNLKAFAPRDYLAIYLSKPDGSELRELGHIERKRQPMRIDFLSREVGRFTRWSAQEIQNLDWTPDGEKISFTYQNRFYTLSVQQ